MVPHFDIFQIQKDGSLRWCEAADTLQAARARVTELAQSFPGQYIIFNQQTAERLIIDAYNPASVQTSNPPATTKRSAYHICRVENEKLRWIEQVDDLQSAEARIKALKSSHPADYLVLDYDPEQSLTPPWLPLTCVLANYLIGSATVAWRSL